MAVVTIKNINSYWQTSPEEDGIIQKVNSAFMPVQRFAKSFRVSAWDGYINLYNVIKKTLPAGLVSDTIKALKLANFETQVLIPDAEPLTARSDGALNFELSDHQIRAVTAMCENSRGIIHAATNAGKTKIAEAWCTLNECNVLYLVPSKELLSQTIESFKRDTNIEVGWISSTEGWNPSKNGVTVCLVSSVIKRKSSQGKRVLNQKVVDQFKELANSFQAVIVDECHHSAAEGWKGILKQLVNARFRFGLSGTPWARDDVAGALKVKSYLGPVIARVSNSELIEKQWSALPLIRMVPVQGGSMKWNPQLQYMDVYDPGIVYNSLRNNMIVKIAQGFVQAGKLCLIIISRIAHSELVSELLDLAGINHRVITGQTNFKDRQRDFQDFGQGVVPVLISNVLGEGVDIPALKGLVLAAGGKGSKQTLQAVGRGLRKKLDGENSIEIYDFLDEGFPFLKGHSQKRIQIYKSENFRIQETQITF